MSSLDPFAGRPSLAARYARATQDALAARLRIACLLGVFLVPGFGVLDAILYPELIRTFLALRLVVVVCVVAVLFVLRTGRGRRHVGALALFAICQAGLAIVLMTAFAGGGSSPYYAGINLTMLAAAVLIPFDTGLSTAFVMILIGSYAALCIGWAGVPDVRLFIANLFFLGSTGLITVVSHRVAGQARRRDFLQQVELEEAGRHRDEFLANVTHELRTPLAAILGFCDMLSDYMGDATSEQRGWLGRVRENALTLYRLIVQLLDFTKLEAGAMQLTCERVALEPIITKVADDMRAIAGANGVAVAVELPPEPPIVAGDAERIEEIITNLAANALKFSGGRPITITAGRTTLDASAWDRIVPDPEPTVAPAYAVVAVVDRGDGIRSEDLRRLFVAFQQLDGSSTRRQGGTGLGLAISARLAAGMGGYIAVRSAPGEGSTFAFLVPPSEEDALEESGAPARVDRNHTAEHHVQPEA
jgi:signal transduction histidine kinase